MLPDVAVSDLLLEWEERAAAGRPVPPEELCRARPELLDELRRCIDRLQFAATLLNLDGAKAGDNFPAVAGFEILDRLGGGGMGVVYRARDTALGRVVAIKMPRPGALTGDVARSRFEREARVLAQLRHPNIVPVHAASLADGQPYFVMDYVPHGSLAAQAARLAGRVEEIAEVIEKVARAVQHAHEQGIVHRDLKPSNILLDERGQPLVCDYGLAALLDADLAEGVEAVACEGEGTGAETTSSRLTRTGAALGTPTYMAPEQFAGGCRAGPAADVWALGVILYELLTGQRPFAAPDWFRLEDAIRAAAPPRPSAVRGGLDRGLDAIVMRCLEKAPDDRYPSAAALADDLARWRDRVRSRKRRRVLAAAALALLGVGVVLTPVVRELRDPDRPARLMERELGAGRPAAVLGETGSPRWSRWRTGAEAAQTSPAKDGSFTMYSWRLSLLELVRDAQCDRYRIRAQVRHEQSDEVGEVGLFFGCREQPAGEGVLLSFGQMTFNDIKLDADVWADVTSHLPAGVPRPPKPKGNRVRLAPRLYSSGGARPGFPHDRRLSGPSPELFTPAGQGGGDWHDLEIRAGPQSIGGYFDGRPVGVLTPDGWANEVKHALCGPPAEPADAPLAAGAAFSPRGGLGLYVLRGSASFRNVVIEPLGEAD